MGKRIASRVLLVGWEGADLSAVNRLLDRQELPTLDSVVQEGVIGRLATLTPPHWPLLWTSMLTGKHAHRHRTIGCIQATERDHEVRPTTNADRQCKAIWNILSQNNMKSVVAGAPLPIAEPIDGVFATQYFHGRGAAHREGEPNNTTEIHPPELGELLQSMRVDPSELTASHLTPFIPRAKNPGEPTDPGLSILATLLAEASSTHAVATHILETHEWDFGFIRYDFIAQAARAFLQFQLKSATKFPKEQVQAYQDVMDGVYCFCDMMLARLIQLAGDDTAILVVSERGRPREDGAYKNDWQAVGYPNPDMIAMKSAGVFKDDLLWGAGLLDIAPTVLTLLGLDCADDMDGRPLLQAFEKWTRCSRYRVGSRFRARQV